MNTPADLDNALTKTLQNTAAIRNLVDDRVYPGDLPDGCTYPAIYFEHGESGSHNNLSGISAGLAWGFIEFGCVGNSRAEVLDVLEAIRRNLVGKRGDIAGDGSVNVQEISLSSGIGAVDCNKSRTVFESSIEMHLQWEEAKDAANV